MNTLTAAQKQILLGIAKDSVENYVKYRQIPDFAVMDERLNEITGAFVTIYNQDKLRGCIGYIIGYQPLWQTVRDLAVAAAAEDNRFSPVDISELPQLNYEISILSVPQEISDWRTIKLGVDGVIVQKDRHSGVFLPQVAAETGWKLEEFLEHLCADKAGLAPDSYKNDPTIKLHTFTAQVFKFML